MHDVIHTMFTWAQITDAVFEKDQEAKNGIVHFIDEVIYPIPAGSLLEVLGEDDRFRVLTEAVEVANLTQLLNSTVNKHIHFFFISFSKYITTYNLLINYK